MGATGVHNKQSAKKEKTLLKLSVTEKTTTSNVSVVECNRRMKNYLTLK